MAISISFAFVRPAFAVFVLFGILTGLAAPASAQSPANEVAAGYAYLHWSNDSPAGWFVEGGHWTNPHLEWLAGVSGSYRTDTVGAIEARLAQHVHEVSIGARMASYRERTVSPFGEARIGFFHATTDVSVPASSPGAGLIDDVFDQSITKSLLQLGGGAAVRVAERAVVRIAAEYGHVFLDSNELGSSTRWRGSVGIALGF